MTTRKSRKAGSPLSRLRKLEAEKRRHEKADRRYLQALTKAWDGWLKWEIIRGLNLKGPKGLMGKELDKWLERFG